MAQTQVERFHHQMLEVIKRYQFRDRNQATCSGVSVSQCYIIETLHRHGPLTMKELAEKMRLSVSTITRVIGPLIQKQLIRRDEDPQDRRIRVIELTAAGESVFETNWRSILDSEKTILEQFAPEYREMLIDFLAKLNSAMDHWQSCCRRPCATQVEDMP